MGEHEATAAIAPAAADEAAAAGLLDRVPGAASVGGIMTQRMTINSLDDLGLVKRYVVPKYNAIGI